MSAAFILRKSSFCAKCENIDAICVTIDCGFLCNFAAEFKTNERIMNIKSIITAVLALLASTACSGGAKNQTVSNSGTDSVMTKGKALVVFFSHAGDNYSVGNIEVGNTKIVADYITEVTGAEQFEIVTHKYDGMAYNPLIELAKKEAKNGELPEYEGDIDLAGYDVVFIGGPVWWGTYPQVMFTFFKKHANDRTT